jgi:hypothetical protein
VFVLDIYNATHGRPHADNVHMANGWYDALAKLLWGGVFL